MRKVIFASVIALAALSACVKAPTYPFYPVITYKSVSSDHIGPGQADTITISFTDGDGDIAVTNTSDSNYDFCGLQHNDSSFLHAQSFNIFAIDSRSSCAQQFASPNLTPSGKYKDISGEMEILLTTTSYTCFDCSSTCYNNVDSVRYTIYVRDQAGHLSNPVTTPPIYISCSY
ncbi:MAG TPA: hypothetical protein VG603_08800 [Chitinophagales bacterium]|nr:hypothetical protein [Chitinophagales bacterium]